MILDPELLRQFNASLDGVRRNKVGGDINTVGQVTNLIRSVSRNKDRFAWFLFDFPPYYTILFS